MTAHPNFQTRPLYAQVRDFLAQRILSGFWGVGQSIPNEIDLAKDYGVSVGTMRKALMTLEAEGLINRKQGTIVSDPSSDVQRERFDNVFRADGRKVATEVRQVECHVEHAGPDDQAHLDVPLGEDVVACSRIVRVDRKPCAYQEVHVPLSLVPQFQMGETWDVFTAAKRHGFRIGRAVEKISFRQAGQVVAVALGVEATSELLVLDRVIFTIDGRPIEWLVGWWQFTGMYYAVGMA